MTIYKDAFESKLQRVLALNEEIAQEIFVTLDIEIKIRNGLETLKQFINLQTSPNSIEEKPGKTP